MISMDNDLSMQLDLVNLIKSQCLAYIEYNIFNTENHADMIKWLKDNAGKRINSIPLFEAAHGYLPDIKNKWATSSSVSKNKFETIIWIENNQARIEFALIWL
jgi:hypothetical protein